KRSHSTLRASWELKRALRRIRTVVERLCETALERNESTRSLFAMGHFYTNYTLKGPSQDAVVAALAGRSAAVTTSENGYVVVFDQASEFQGNISAVKLASQLSEDLSCPVLVVSNYDDDMLWLQLFIDGKGAEDYNSCPLCFHDGATPQGAA